MKFLVGDWVILNCTLGTWCALLGWIIFWGVLKLHHIASCCRGLSQAVSLYLCISEKFQDHVVYPHCVVDVRYPYQYPECNRSPSRPIPASLSPPYPHNTITNQFALTAFKTNCSGPARRALLSILCCPTIREIGKILNPSGTKRSQPIIIAFSWWIFCKTSLHPFFTQHYTRAAESDEDYI